MHVLITGAAGMVGRRLAARLAREGQCAGRAIDRLTLTDVAPASLPPELAKRATIRVEDAVGVEVLAVLERRIAPHDAALGVGRVAEVAAARLKPGAPRLSARFGLDYAREIEGLEQLMATATRGEGHGKGEGIEKGEG